MSNTQQPYLSIVVNLIVVHSLALLTAQTETVGIGAVAEAKSIGTQEKFAILCGPAYPRQAVGFNNSRLKVETTFSLYALEIRTDRKET